MGRSFLEISKSDAYSQLSLQQQDKLRALYREEDGDKIPWLDGKPADLSKNDLLLYINSAAEAARKNGSRMAPAPGSPAALPPPQAQRATQPPAVEGMEERFVREAAERAAQLQGVRQAIARLGPLRDEIIGQHKSQSTASDGGISYLFNTNREPANGPARQSFDAAKAKVDAYVEAQKDAIKQYAAWVHGRPIYLSEFRSLTNDLLAGLATTHAVYRSSSDGTSAVDVTAGLHKVRWDTWRLGDEENVSLGDASVLQTARYYADKLATAEHEVQPGRSVGFQQDERGPSLDIHADGAFANQAEQYKAYAAAQDLLLAQRRAQEKAPKK